MRVLDAQTQAALDSGRIARRDFLLFDFPSGLWGFWSGAGPEEWNGVVYQGAGALIQISDIQRTNDGGVGQVSLTLSSIPNSDLTPDILSTIEDESYKARPMQIAIGRYATETGQRLGVDVVWRGTVDTIDHDEQVGGTATITVNCVSRRLDDSKKGGAARSKEHQKQVDPNDRFFEHAATVEGFDLQWGPQPQPAAPPPPPRKKRKKFLGIF